MDDVSFLYDEIRPGIVTSSFLDEDGNPFRLVIGRQKDGAKVALLFCHFTRSDYDYLGVLRCDADGEWGFRSLINLQNVNGRAKHLFRGMKFDPPARFENDTVLHALSSSQLRLP